MFAEIEMELFKESWKTIFRQAGPFVNDHKAEYFAKPICCRVGGPEAPPPRNFRLGGLQQPLPLRRLCERSREWRAVKMSLAIN